MEEIWKKVAVEPFTEKYEVSSEGQIRSLHWKEPKIMKQTFRSEYLGISLRNNGKQKTFSTHRLVAETFIPNPECLPIVNHKNGIKTDNRLENLEWNISSENRKHALTLVSHNSSSIRVSQYTMSGDFVSTFNSLTEASNITGAHDSKISLVCKGKRNHTKGFVWRYTDMEWKDTAQPYGKEIENYPKYIITRDGKVYSKSFKKYLSIRKNSGYEYVTIYKGKKNRRDVAVHILVAETYLENKLNLPYVNHKDRNRSNNNVENLEWCTPSENMFHAFTSIPTENNQTDQTDQNNQNINQAC